MSRISPSSPSIQDRERSCVICDSSSAVRGRQKRAASLTAARASAGGALPSEPLLGEPIAVIGIRTFVDLLDGQAALTHQTSEEFLALVNARPLGQSGNGPTGQESRILVGVVQVCEVKSFEELGLTRPL